MKAEDWPLWRWLLVALEVGLAAWCFFGVLFPALGIEVSRRLPGGQLQRWRVHVVAGSAVVGGLCACVLLALMLGLARRLARGADAHKALVREFVLTRLFMVFTMGLPMAVLTVPLRHAGMLPMRKLEPLVFIATYVLVFSCFLLRKGLRNPLLRFPSRRDKP